MVMVNAFAAFGFAELCLSLVALELFASLDTQCGGAGTCTSTTTSAEAPLLHSGAEVLPPLAAVVVAVALTYRHLMRRHDGGGVPVAGAAGNGRRSISRLVIFVLCVSAGTLEYIVFGLKLEDHAGAQARALALAALRALPAAATATFFPGMMLIIVAHVRAGGEGGGTGADVAAGDGPIQGLLRLLAKIAAGMAAALVGLIAMALTLYGATC